FGLGVATDHDLLLLETLDLEPLWAARAAVRRIAFLRHDAFQAELARVREEVGARTHDVIAVAQHRGLVVGRGEQARERRLAIFEARAGEVPTVEVQQVEDHVRELDAGGARAEILKRLKTTGAIGQEHRDLAVENRLLDRKPAEALPRGRDT